MHAVHASGSAAGNAHIGTQPSDAASPPPDCAGALIPWRRARGAAALAAGVAAQYLELHPSASPQEVRQALLESATTGVVRGADTSWRPARLLYTNYKAPSASTAGGSGDDGAAAGSSGSGDGSGGLGTGAIVGIAVGAAAGELLTAGLRCCSLACCGCPCYGRWLAEFRISKQDAAAHGLLVTTH